MKRTVLYFGSFNPIHRGHLSIAESVLERNPETELWYVVSPQSPFKSKLELASETDRLVMVRIAIEELITEKKHFQGRLQVSDIEFSLPKPTRTLTTLEALQEEYPHRSFTLLIGGDNVDTFDRWWRYEDILARFPVWVYPREGYRSQKPELEKRLTVLSDYPLFPQMATHIRTLLTQNREQARTLLPEGVYQYIHKQKLYGCNSSL